MKWRQQMSERWRKYGRTYLPYVGIVAILISMGGRMAMAARQYTGSGYGNGDNGDGRKAGRRSGSCRNSSEGTRYLCLQHISGSTTAGG